MSETKQIPTVTSLITVGSTISIITKYAKEKIGVTFAFISEMVGGETQGGTLFIEGEGGVQYDSSKFTFSKNSNGELIVSGLEATKIGIDTSTGQLTYTE